MSNKNKKLKKKLVNCIDTPNIVSVQNSGIFYKASAPILDIGDTEVYNQSNISLVSANNYVYFQTCTIFHFSIIAMHSCQQ